MNRRDFLKTSAAFAVLPQPTGLNDLARASGRVFGACSAGLADEAYRRLFLTHCGVLTTELEFKMRRLRPTATEWNWQPADALADFAREHRLKLRGHTLVWHEAMPDWWPKERAEAVLVDHIATVCSRMGEQVDTWDVVNEPLAGDGLRPTPLLAQLGPRYIDRAFRTAAAAAPNARLCLNEFGLEYDTAEDQAKREALLRLLGHLQDNNVPVHMVGIQGHLHPRKRFEPALFARFLARLRAMGLTVMITELDCHDRRLPANPYVRDRAVAQAVREVLDVALAEPAVEGIVTWGLADRYSWLSEFPNTRRWDGLRSRGTLFDEDLRPKASFRAVEAALSRAAPRS